MIEAIDVQIAPLDRELRAYARRQTGCKALIAAYYGTGEQCAVTIVSELGGCQRFSSSREAVRYSGMESIRSAPRARASEPPGAAGAPLGAMRGRAARTVSRQPRPRVLPAGGRAPRRQPRVPSARAQAAQALLPDAQRTRR